MPKKKPWEPQPVWRYATIAHLCTSHEYLKAVQRVKAKAKAAKKEMKHVEAAKIVVLRALKREPL